ncbi:RNA polymerase sigma factor RpoD/SigA [Pedobacter sp. MC2016-14]|uniref:sigma-70 family RNA polymerase sigma factor n=1 Tax=Pedobacter sp. MC2016-14 TaxID=2897327 RepID=UPI001E2B790F|nr:RNA polymerase sigma factor RpoD/SigA [Pedobacter sp. MC2016-14]MCD0490242.1 RNA polymerase sigma factor RpoD/SigA [Pedobacter sp. MC2016-14]
MRALKISQSITNRNSDSIEKYLADIAKIELLSAEEEINLARKIKMGDQSAMDKLVKTNLRFVVSVAKKYQNRGLALADLINEGNLGLIKAAGRFDDTKGFKFISFAVWWIRQNIMQAISEHNRVVRLPANQIAGIMRIKKCSSELEQQLEREPTLAELSELVDMTEEKINDHLWNAPMSYSLDMQSSEDGFTLMDVLEQAGEPEPDASLMTDSRNDELGRLLQALPIRAQEIITLFYGLYDHPALSLDDIAERYNLGRERVRQIKDQGLKLLRVKVKSNMVAADYAM